jgi:hypothetical protein
LRRHDEELGDADDGEAEAKAILLGDQTLEAMARSLAAMDGAATVDLDELAVLLRGLGEYKRGGGGDRGRFLGLWSGGPWRFSRVGGKGGKRNAVNLRIPRPTLVICGGLQTVLHELLGDEGDGLRPRWLPHLAAMPTSRAVDGAHGVDDMQAVTNWQELIGRLIDNRDRPVTRTLAPSAYEAFRGHQHDWKRQATARCETASTSAALWKADIHLARIALVLHEAEPERRDQVDEDRVNHAAQIVEFALDCWRALPEQGSLALTRRDEVLDRGIGKLISWLEEHGGKAARRELQRAHVAGVRTASDLDALLARYEASYPGTIGTVTPEGGGLPIVVISAPIRRGL